MAKNADFISNLSPLDYHVIKFNTFPRQLWQTIQTQTLKFNPNHNPNPNEKVD